MNDPKPTVVVVTRYWPTALSVIRSLGQAGFIVDLVASMPKPGESAIAASSRYVRHSVETVCKNVKLSDDPELFDAILSLKDSDSNAVKPVLFPTDDYTASFIDRHGDILRDHFILPSAGDGSAGSITALMNKETQSRLASGSGLLCPREWKISLEDPVSIPEDIVYPCFVKPLDSVTGFKKEMKKCASEEELISHLTKLQSKNPDRSMLVQEFLDIEGEIDLSGVSIKGENGSPEVLIPAIIRKSHIARYERGVTLAGTIHPAEELGVDVLNGISRLLISSGYRGIFDLEINIANGKLWFGELNLRSGGPNYAYFYSGINLPAIAVKDMLGLPVSESEKKVSHYGTSFVYEKVAWKDHMMGYLSRAELNEVLGRADHGLIRNADDPIPYDLFRKKTSEELLAMKKKRFKKQLKRFVSRIKRVIRH